MEQGRLIFAWPTFAQFVSRGDPADGKEGGQVNDGINWDLVNRVFDREGERMIWKPYGLPEIVDPFGSAFAPGVAPFRLWDIPETSILSAALTGAFFTKRANPAQPVTVAEIVASAREALDAGATTVHIHVRDDRGYNRLDFGRFREVAAELRQERPDLAVDGCLVCALDGEWAEMRRVLDAGIFDVVPVNSTATYCGDSLFAKPIHMLLEKTRLIQESGAKPQIAVYTDGDVDNARRYLIDSGLVESPSYWVVLPALPGGSPMNNPMQMIQGLVRMVTAIRDTDPQAVILVCAAGRASTYLSALALCLGLHIRVGMEDSVWYWPHRDDLIESNAAHVALARQLVTAMGRRVATVDEYRDLVGLRARSGDTR
jgi:3-keto-5-aminohexanoate cleavage enzyme